MRTLPVLPFVAAATLAAFYLPTEATERPEDLKAVQRQILAEQTDEATQGRPCVPPDELNGREPLGVVVSPANVPGTMWAANIAYELDVDTAWTEAKLGEIVVRCVIIAVPTEQNER